MHTKFILAAQIIISLSLPANAALFALRMDGRSQGSGTGSYGMAATGVTSSAQVSNSSKTKARNFGIVEEKVLRQYIKKNVEVIKQIAKSSQYTDQQKLDYIKNMVNTVASYRAKNWTKSSFAEHQMDLTIKPFESFPDSREFKPQSCSHYQHHLMLEWEPDARNLRPVQPGVAEALMVLKQICKS